MAKKKTIKKPDMKFHSALVENMYKEYRDKHLNYYLIVKKIERDILVPNLWGVAHLEYKNDKYEMLRAFCDEKTIKRHKELLRNCPDNYKLFKVGSIQEVKIKRKAHNNNIDYGFLM